MNKNEAVRLRLIADYVRMHGEPRVVTLNEAAHGPNCHMFIHSKSIIDIDKIGVIFVNKNGNFFRLIKQDNNRWLLVKTWNGIFRSESWALTSLERDDPMQVIQLATGKTKPTRLTLLPHDACTYPRRAVFGGHIIRAYMMQTKDQFRLVLRDGTESTFKGKLWESADAIDWCHANIAPVIVGGHDQAIIHYGKNHIPKFETQEDHPLWGTF